MEHATLVTIPTIVHLMHAKDSKIPERNQEVLKAGEVFPEIFASTDHENSVNARWKRAKVRFTLEDIGKKDYLLQDFKDLGVEPGRDEEIIFKCSSPLTKDEEETMRKLKERFGTPGFQGLEVFVLARIKMPGREIDLTGCTSSVSSSAWVDVGVADSEDPSEKPEFLLMAHEIGHFLSLSHNTRPNALMNKDLRGPELSDAECDQAHKHAVEVMKKKL